jgi:pyridoxal phosphate enzyme (YggS family)
VSSTADEAARVRAALRVVRDRIAAVEREWTHEVEITAVTKGHPARTIEVAVAAGCRAIGENYAQELLSKRSTIDAIPGEIRPRIDFIGQLQSNKVRQLAGLVDRWATVDRVSVAEEIARRDPNGRVLVQVDAVGEVGKGGCAVDDVEGLVRRCRDLGLLVEGLMTVGPTAVDPHGAALAFRVVRRLVDGLGLSVCSMGMTRDLDQAVASGATNVRVGSALFGPRDGGVAAANATAERPSTTPVHPEGEQRG